MEKLVDIVTFIHQEIFDIFGDNGTEFDILMTLPFPFAKDGKLQSFTYIRNGLTDKVFIFRDNFSQQRHDQGTTSLPTKIRHSRTCITLRQCNQSDRYNRKLLFCVFVTFPS